MRFTLDTAEKILRGTSALRLLYNEGYELSFESDRGRQIAINRKSAATAVRLWVENTFDPHRIGLSSEVRITHYPETKPRAHLSAKKLTGPYARRRGNDCWYIALRSEEDLRKLLSAYL